jgi:glycosyltransferase involved in cell wall biosynthesis
VSAAPAAGPPGGPRVAYVLGTSEGGTGAHVAMLAAGVAARGWQVLVIGPARAGRQFFGEPAARCPGSAAGLPPVGFVPLEISDRPRPAHDLVAVLRLRALLRGWRPGVVHAHGLRAGALAALAAGRGGPPVAVTVHNAPPAAPLPRAVYAVLERIVARRAAAVTWVSSDLAARLRRRGARDAGRALVPAPPAAPPTAAQAAEARETLAAGARPVVLGVGRLAAQKGFGVLLAAAQRWQHRDPVPLLAIAGDGPLAGDLAAQARAGRLQVSFLGRRGDVPALLAAAAVVVVPSLWEGQPLIVQEALRAGAPLVASRTGGIPELTGEDAALLVAPGDPDALARAVTSVLDDTALADALRAAARARAASLPTEPGAVDAAAVLYRRLAGQQHTT